MLGVFTLVENGPGAPCVICYVEASIFCSCSQAFTSAAGKTFSSINNSLPCTWHRCMVLLLRLVIRRLLWVWINACMAGQIVISSITAGASNWSMATLRMFNPTMCIGNFKMLPQTVLIISPDMQPRPDQDISGHVTFFLAHAQFVWLYISCFAAPIQCHSSNPLDGAAACVTAAASAACSVFQAPGNAARADLAVALQGLQCIKH